MLTRHTLHLELSSRSRRLSRSESHLVRLADFPRRDGTTIRPGGLVAGLERQPGFTMAMDSRAHEAESDAVEDAGSIFTLATIQGVTRKIQTYKLTILIAKQAIRILV